MLTTEDIIGRYVKVDGTRIFYDELGEGTPVVCVHSAGASSLLYQYLLPLLAEKGFRGLAPDLPGRSRSYPVNWEPATTIHEHAESTHKFIKTVCGDEKPVVIGTSIGGNIVVDLLAHHSEDLLAAIPMEGAARTPTFPPSWEALEPSWSPGWQAALELGATATLNKGTPPEKVTELRWIHRTGGHQASMGDANGWATHDVRGQLGDVKCPVLIIGGKEDFFFPEELAYETAREIPHAEVRILDNIGHYPSYEDPELVANMIEEFVQSKVPATA